MYPGPQDASHESNDRCLRREAVTTAVHQPPINKEAPHCVTCLCLNTSATGDCEPNGMYREPCFPRCSLQNGYDNREDALADEEDYSAVEDAPHQSKSRNMSVATGRRVLSSGRRTSTVNDLLREMKLVSPVQSDDGDEAGIRGKPVDLGYERLSDSAIRIQGDDKASSTTANNSTGTQRRRRRPLQQRHRANTPGAHYSGSKDPHWRTKAGLGIIETPTARSSAANTVVEDKRRSRSCERNCWPGREQQQLDLDEEITDIVNEADSSRAKTDAYHALKSEDKWQSIVARRSSILMGAGDVSPAIGMERSSRCHGYEDVLLVEAKKFTSKPDYLESTTERNDPSEDSDIEAYMRELKTVRGEFIERIYEGARNLHRLQRQLDGWAEHRSRPQLTHTRSVSTMTSARFCCNELTTKLP